MDIADDGAADEDVLDGAEMRVFQLVEHDHVVELDVEVLVDRFQRPAQRDVVFQFHRYRLLCECFEEAVWFRTYMRR